MKFYHRIAGAKFYMPDGRDIAFAGGEFDTSMVTDKATRELVELELRKIANVPSSMVFTKEAVRGVEESLVVKEIEASATTAFDAAHKIPAGTQTVPLTGTMDHKPTLKETAGNAHVASAGSAPNSAITDQLEAARKAIASTSHGSGNSQASDSAAKSK